MHTDCQIHTMRKTEPYRQSNSDRDGRTQTIIQRQTRQRQADETEPHKQTEIRAIHRDKDAQTIRHRET